MFVQQLQLPVVIGEDLFKVMYTTKLNDRDKPAKTLYAMFRVFDFEEQHRAADCETQTEHLKQMRALPHAKVHTTRYQNAHATYRPISGSLLKSLTTKLTQEDIAADNRWLTHAKVLTTSNSSRAAINMAAAINHGERTGQQVITWRRKLNLDATEGVVNHLYTNGENPELTSWFVKNGPGQILDNQCGNVELRVANGTHCIYHSLVWIDDDVRARMQAKINASNDAIVHVDIPPDYIVVELPDQKAADWPDELNLCPSDENGVRAAVYIPIGMSTRNGGDTNSVKIAGMKLGYKAHGVDLAFALTVWKAQGMTLSHVIALLDGGPDSKITFECMYVIKSRVPSIDRIKCLGVAKNPEIKLSRLRPSALAVRYRQDIGDDGYWRESGHA
jgi:hypothetical protein